MVYNYPYDVKKGESNMNTKEIKLADGTILTPFKNNDFEPLIVEFPDKYF